MMGSSSLHGLHCNINCNMDRRVEAETCGSVQIHTGTQFQYMNHSDKHIKLKQGTRTSKSKRLLYSGFGKQLYRLSFPSLRCCNNGPATPISNRTIPICKHNTNRQLNTLSSSQVPNGLKKNMSQLAKQPTTSHINSQIHIQSWNKDGQVSILNNQNYNMNK